MKIYYVVQAYGKDVVGGAEHACRMLAEGMEGHAEVSVFTTCAAEPATWANRLPAGTSEEDGVKVTRFANTSMRSRRFDALSRRLFLDGHPTDRLQERWVRAQGPECPALVEEIRGRADEPDLWVFYTYLYYPTLFGLPMVGARAVLHPALHDEPPARLPIVRRAIRSAAALSLQTPEEWELAVRFAGWPSGMVRMVGMGVEEGSGDVEAFRNEFGLGSDPYLLYLGRVDRGKGTDELASYFAEYKDRHPGPLKLVIAGHVVHSPPEHPDVLVTGTLSEGSRWAAMEGCEVFVHPSAYESFGLVLLEAWMKSRPALVNARCTATSGHAERAKAGLTFGDQVEFEAALEALLDDRSAAAALGRQGRSYAEQFSWDRVLLRYREFLEEVAEHTSEVRASAR